MEATVADTKNTKWQRVEIAANRNVYMWRLKQTYICIYKETSASILHKTAFRNFAAFEYN